MEYDNSLRREVLEQLRFDPNIDAEDIVVSVPDGAIILNGTVPTYADKVTASKSIEQRYAGVEVVNNLVVRLPDSLVRLDADIREAAKNAIGVITTVPPESLKVTVRNGWLKLEGIVEHCAQKEAVEIAVRYVTGLTGITNRIAVRTLVS